MSSKLTSIKDFLEAVSYFAVIAGIIVAFWQYSVHIDLWRKERSFEIVSQFQENLANARIQVVKPWLDYDFDELNNRLSDREWDHLVDLVIESNSDRSPEDIRLAIISLAEFLDTAFDCARRLVCDKSVLEAQLEDYSVAFYCLYAKRIKAIRRRSSMESLGVELGDFVNSQGGCSAFTPSENVEQSN